VHLGLLFFEDVAVTAAVRDDTLLASEAGGETMA
jgi:hypothetical protein